MKKATKMLSKSFLLVTLGVWATIMAGAAARPAPAPAAIPDPIEGRWWGTIGPPQDRIESGMELKRNPQGELKVYLYRPVINVYGAELPGSVVREGDRYLDKEVEFSARLAGDTLELTRKDGTSATFRRATTLPAEAAIPDLPRGPGPKWQIKLGGVIYAPVAVRDGVVYAGTTGGVVNAVSLADGKFIWGFSAGRPLHGEVLPTDEHLYFVCDDGFLYKLDRKTGKEVWRYDLGDARVPRITQIELVYGYDYQAPRPTLHDGVLYVGSGDGGFHAVKAATGQRVWRFGARGTIRDNALIDGPRVVFGTLEGLLYAVDRASGREVWHQDLKGPVTSSPALVSGKLIVGTRGSTLYGLKPETGETLWTRSFWGSWVESTAVPFGDRFYIGSSDLRRASCFDPQDGRVVWRTDVYGSPWGRPVVTDRYVFIGAEGANPYLIRHQGGLCALDRESGRIVWRWPLPELPGVAQTGFAGGPTLAGDTLVIGGLDGTLYAFPAA